jgi:hypothetical protein
MTPLQAAMIKKIAYNECTPVNGAEPQSADDAETWAVMIIETNSDKGVFTSLQMNKLAWHSGDKGEDAVVGLTEKGFEAFKQLIG